MSRRRVLRVLLAGLALYALGAFGLAIAPWLQSPRDAPAAAVVVSRPAPVPPTPLPPSEPPAKAVRIPAVIHQTWRDRSVTSSAAAQSWRTLNPHYEYRFYTDAEMHAYVAAQHPELMVTWGRLQIIQQCDLFRYVLLFDHGGYYADIDVTCTTPIDAWTSGQEGGRPIDLIVGLEAVQEQPTGWEKYFARRFQFCQWTMAAAPGHPALRAVIDLIVRIVAALSDEDLKLASIVKTTGPGVWSDAVLEVLDGSSALKLGTAPLTAVAVRDRAWRVGSALMLPVTAFGSGGGGSHSAAARRVLVRHAFSGSWKAAYAKSKKLRLEKEAREARRDNRVSAEAVGGSKQQAGGSRPLRCANTSAPSSLHTHRRVCVCCGPLQVQTQLQFLDDGNPYSKLILHAAAGGGAAPPVEITLELGEPQRVAGYYLASGGADFPPAWTLFGRREGGEWEQLDEQAHPAAPRWYQYVRLEVAAGGRVFSALQLRVPASTRLQLSEFGTLATPQEAPRVMPLPLFEAASAGGLAFTAKPGARIPKIIHQTWKSTQLPASFTSYVETWMKLNPDYEYWFWTDNENDALVRTHYPAYHAMFKGYATPVQRADAIRYFILHRFGGLYIDADFEALRPIGPLLETHSAVFGVEPEAHSHILYDIDRLVSNAFMASCPSHPLFREIFRELERRSFSETVSATGPRMVDHAVFLYESGAGAEPDAPGIFFPAHNLVFPEFDAANLKAMATARCASPASPRVASKCRELGPGFGNRAVRPDAYGNHHWVHTWWDRGQGPAATDVHELGRRHHRQVFVGGH